MNVQHEEDFPGWFWRVVREDGPTQAVQLWVQRLRGQVGDVLLVTRLPYVVITLVEQYAVSAPDLGGLVSPWQVLQALRNRLAAPQLPGEFDRLYDEYYTKHNRFVSLLWEYRTRPSRLDHLWRKFIVSSSQTGLFTPFGIRTLPALTFE